MLAILCGRWFEGACEWLNQRIHPFILYLLPACYALLPLIVSLGFCHHAAKQPAPQLTPLMEQTLARLDQLPDDQTIAFGPSHNLPLWMARGDLVWRATPWQIDWKRFVHLLEREQIRYVLLDQETLARRPYLSVLTNPSGMGNSGWRLIGKDRDQEGFFLLWEYHLPSPLPQGEETP
jgi:hypothetical protein